MSSIWIRITNGIYSRCSCECWFPANFMVKFLVVGLYFIQLFLMGLLGFFHRLFNRFNLRAKLIYLFIGILHQSLNFISGRIRIFIMTINFSTSLSIHSDPKLRNFKKQFGFLGQQFLIDLLKLLFNFLFSQSMDLIQIFIIFSMVFKLLGMQLKLHFYFLGFFM